MASRPLGIAAAWAVFVALGKVTRNLPRWVPIRGFKALAGAARSEALSSHAEERAREARVLCGRGREPHCKSA